MHEKLWFTMLLRGIVATLFGLTALCWPGLTLAFLIMIFGFFAVIDGFSLIAGALAWQGEHEDWWVPLVTGIGIAILGLVCFLRPELSGVVVVAMIAARFMIVGMTEIMMAVRIRKVVEGEWFLMAQGALSFCLGILLISWPEEGAVALAWLFGTIALLGGVLTIIISLRFRGLLNDVGAALSAAPTGEEPASGDTSAE